MEFKKCSMCGEEKPLTEFAFRNKSKGIYRIVGNAKLVMPLKDIMRIRRFLIILKRESVVLDVDIMNA